jgi:hypothetical protein
MTEGRDDGEAKNQEPGFFAAVGMTEIKKKKDRDSSLRSE